jgi:hypothetical protein
MSHPEFKDCIIACVACAVACNHCATSCLGEEDVTMMAKCIELDLQCAAICRSAAEVMSLGSGYSSRLCQICAEACRACADECSKYNDDHCQRCAEACIRCAEECEKIAA